METLETKSARTFKNVLDNKLATLEEISDLHNALEFQSTIKALKESIHFAARLAGEENQTADKKYYFDHITKMADAMHYVSCIENILTSSRDIDAAEREHKN
jgi:hypothetical protein